ncbi:MAG: signal peptidase I [Terriglobales bacterium]
MADSKKTGKEKTADASAPPPEPRKETLPESIASIASVLVSGLFIITFVFQAFEIPSGSMEDTLLIGDHVFVDRLGPTAKAAYTGPLMAYREIHRGDIIVFLHPSREEPGTYLVKRIMGLPGDRIHLKDGKLFINGVAQNEPYLNPKAGYVPYVDNFPAVSPDEIGGVTLDWRLELPTQIQKGELVVPKDHYFGMGDHRDNSRDSRFWGFIPRENIIGKPLFIYWSFKTPPDQVNKTELKDRVAFMLHIVIHFFDETRWSRMFHRVG